MNLTTLTGKEADVQVELLSMWQLEMQIDPGVLNWQLKNQTIGDITAGVGGREFWKEQTLVKFLTKASSVFYFSETIFKVCT